MLEFDDSFELFEMPELKGLMREVLRQPDPASAYDPENPFGLDHDMAGSCSEWPILPPWELEELFEYDRPA